MSIYEDLKILEKRISEEGYEIDRFEIRERIGNYQENKIDGRSSQRAVGRDPINALEEWNTLDGEDYIIEVFLSGRNQLDRIIYDPERETAEYIGFSGNKPSLEELLEE